MACFLMHCALVGCVFGEAASFTKMKKEQKKAPFGVYPWYLARAEALLRTGEVNSLEKLSKEHENYSCNHYF